MKTKNIFSFAALAIALAACSSDNDVNKVESPLQKGKIVTLTATISPDNASTRSLTDNNDGTMSANWEMGDEILVTYRNTSDAETEAKATVTSIDEAGNATITAELTDPKGETQVRFRYPYNFDFRSLAEDQTGKLDFIYKKCAMMNGSGQMVVKEDKAALPGGVHMHHNNSIMKLTISDGTKDITSEVTSIYIHNDFEIDGQVRNQDYNIRNLSSINPIYLCLNFPPYEVNVNIKVTTASGKEYSLSKSGIKLDGGKMYTVMPLVMGEAPATPDIYSPDMFINGGDPFASN